MFCHSQERLHAATSHLQCARPSTASHAQAVGLLYAPPSTTQGVILLLVVHTPGVYLLHDGSLIRSTRCLPLLEFLALGFCAQGDAAAALQQLQEAAAQGDPYATFNLGYMHMKGMGTEANATAARANFEIAARAGIPSAYNGLGVLQYEGRAGAPVDYVAARQAFETGAILGDPDAMFNLATIHAGNTCGPLLAVLTFP